MSQPRRRRRRGRRGQGSSGGENQAQQPVKREQAKEVTQKGPDGSGPQGGGGRRRRRRRRGRSGGGGGGRKDNIPSPKLSEDLFGLLTKGAPPEKLMLDPDGEDLDELIGELQSTWGVPQYPQEYRITIKVAETKERRDQSGDNGGRTKKSDPSNDGGPKREKAPSPAKLAAGSGDGPQREKAPKRRKRRRGRGRKRGGGNSTGAAS